MNSKNKLERIIQTAGTCTTDPTEWGSLCRDCPLNDRKYSNICDKIPSLSGGKAAYIKYNTAVELYKELYGSAELLEVLV